MTDQEPSTKRYFGPEAKRKIGEAYNSWTPQEQQIFKGLLPTLSGVFEYCARNYSTDGTHSRKIAG